MAFALWQYVVAGSFLLLAGGIQAVSPGLEADPAKEQYARATRGMGIVVMIVGIAVMVLGAWRLL